VRAKPPHGLTKPRHGIRVALGSVHEIVAVFRFGFVCGRYGRLRNRSTGKHCPQRISECSRRCGRSLLSAGSCQSRRRGIMVAYGLLATAIAGMIRRPVWWAGMLSGLIPALALTAVLWSPSEGTSYYYATAAEVSSANTINAISSALTIVWCTTSTAALLPLTARYSSRKFSTVSDRWQT
jgi:hypothetical protein